MAQVWFHIAAVIFHSAFHISRENWKQRSSFAWANRAFRIVYLAFTDLLVSCSYHLELENIVRIKERYVILGQHFELN